MEVACQWVRLPEKGNHETSGSPGSVYQAGTLSGNPVAVAAGGATLDCSDRIFRSLESLTRELIVGLEMLLGI